MRKLVLLAVVILLGCSEFAFGRQDSRKGLPKGERVAVQTSQADHPIRPPLDGSFVNPKAGHAKLRPTIERLPISFESNRGQFDPSVRYAASGPGYSLGLNSGGATLMLTTRPPITLKKRKPAGGAAWLRQAISAVEALAGPSSEVLRIGFVGSSARASVQGVDKQAGVSNYFIGNNPKKWVTHVLHYGQVAIRGVYPRIDAAFRGDPDRLELDFTVERNGDPGQIRLAFDGAQGVNLDSEGNLHVRLSEGQVLLRAPTLYQELGGKRVDVPGAFRLFAKDEVGFSVGSYDHSRALVIDPVLDFSVVFGGSGGTQPSALAVDGSGNIYLSGETCSPDFPTTSGQFQTVYAPFSTLCEDAFVMKLDPTASSLIYSDVIGGGNLDVGLGMTIDGSGDAYLTGTTDSTDFPTTSGAFESSGNLNSCSSVPFFGGGPCPKAFVLKLSADGSNLVYSTYLGGSEFDLGLGISTDGTNDGNAYVAGSTDSSDFPTTSGAFQTTYSGGTCSVSPFGASLSVPCFDGFVTRLSSDGSTLVYSTYLGGADGLNGAIGIQADSSGDATIVGATGSTTFPTTSGAAQTTFAGSDMDAFVAKLNSSGSGLAYSTFLGGGSGGSLAFRLALDPSGNVYVVGGTTASDFPVTAGAYQSTYQANGQNTVCMVSTIVLADVCGNGFVVKLSATGTTIDWGTFLGGNGPDGVGDVALDASGNVWVTGFTQSTSPAFPTTSDAYYTSAIIPASGGQGAFLSELSSDGTKLEFSTLYGAGDFNTIGSAVATDASGNVYFAGLEDEGVNVGSGFPVTPGTYLQAATQLSTTEGFVAKFSPGTTPVLSVSPTTLTFNLLPLGQSSAPQTVTLQNTSSTAIPLAITVGPTSIQTSSFTQLGTAIDSAFLATDDCGSSLPANSSCTLSVTFQPAPPPASSGVTNPSSVTETATLGIESNAAGTPMAVSLTGDSGFSATARVTPSSLTFPAQAPGTSETQGVQINNDGVVPLTISSVTVSGTDSADFSVTQGSTACSGTLTLNSCNFTVTFSPPANATGSLTASITIDSNAANGTVTLPLSGSVTTGPSIVIAPSSYPGPDCKPTALNTAENNCSGIDVSNYGGTALVFSSIALSGSSAFTADTADTTCSTSSSLAPQSSCVIAANFDPTTSGVQNATWTLTDNDPTKTQTVDISGTGYGANQPVAQLFFVSPNPLDLGPVPIGQTVGLVNGTEYGGGFVTIVNGGAGTLTFSSITISPTGEFSFVPDPSPSQQCLGNQITAGNTCDFYINFTPNAAGPQSATLTITSNGLGSPQTLPLSGTGVGLPRVLVSPSSLNFGKVSVGQNSPTFPVVLSNTGSAALQSLNISASSPFSQINNCPVTGVPAGGNCTIQIQFTPSAAGNVSGLLTLTDNAPGGTQVVSLAGFGGSGPLANISPASLDFGNQIQGTASASKTVTLTNTGSALLSIAKIYVSNGDFTQTNNCPASLSSGTSCAIQINFKPSTSGIPEAGLLLVADNAGGSPQGVGLSGTGVQTGSAATTTALSSSLNPSNTGQAVTFTATVTSTTAGTPTGTVTFLDGRTSLGTGTLNGSAVATLTVSNLTAGTHSITASYSGDATFAPSTSSAVTQTVNGQATTTTLKSSVNPSTVGQSVTFTATVTSSASGTPTGTVTFLDGSTTLGTGTLNTSGVATFSTTSLTAGTHSITASYGGDATFDSSTSSALTETVNGGSANFSESANPTSETVTAGQSTSYTLTLTPSNGFNQAVTLACSGAPTGATCAPASGTVMLNGSSASSVKFNVSTTARGALPPAGIEQPMGPIAGWPAGALLMVALILLGLAWRGRNRRGRLALGVAIGLLALVMAGCGGGSGSTSSSGSSSATGTPAGTYTLTLTGTSGATTHSTTVTLNVN